MKHSDRKAEIDIGRRDVLALLGLAAFAGRLHAQPDSVGSTNIKPPACVLTPEQTEGPYFTDVQLNRSDIRTDPADGSVRAGVPLMLTLRVSSVGGTGCAPLAGAIVDIWHCDAAGVYSDVAEAVGKRFLRGYQVTDANGGVRFATIYPGWYSGRAVHIHFKVRAKARSGRKYEFSSQLYFDDSVTDRVFTHNA